VHVVGAVRRPGVYRMKAGARIQDAVARAGGASARADLAGLNLAAKVADAQQVVVPRRGTDGMAASTGSAAPAPAPAGAGAPGGAAGPVNLNSAGIEQLETLDGVGPVTARKILEYRTAHGGFRSIEDLAQVPGIGPKRLAAIKPRVTL
jgi:competence protein ComEA